MTIHVTRQAPTTLDFAPGSGRPSHLQFMTHDEQYRAETRLVTALRQHTRTLAQECLHHTASEYADCVIDLTDEDDLTNRTDAPTFHAPRFVYLLHAYANYMPSPDCYYLDVRLPNAHAWLAPDGNVVIDIITTLAMTELSPDEDQILVIDTVLAAHELFGHALTGIRLIVLDAPYESSFYNDQGVGEPLLTCPLNPLGASTASITGGVW